VGSNTDSEVTECAKDWKGSVEGSEVKWIYILADRSWGDRNRNSEVSEMIREESRLPIFRSGEKKIFVVTNCLKTVFQFED